MTLIFPDAYLQRWLADHPGRDDQNAPLWCALDRPEEFSSRLFTETLEVAGEGADITSRIRSRSALPEMTFDCR